MADLGEKIREKLIDVLGNPAMTRKEKEAMKEAGVDLTEEERRGMAKINRGDHHVSVEHKTNEDGESDMNRYGSNRNESDESP